MVKKDNVKFFEIAQIRYRENLNPKNFIKKIV